MIRHPALRCITKRVP